MDPRDLQKKTSHFSRLLEQVDSESEGSSEGGKAEEVKFRYRDAMSVDPRDDLLPLAVREAFIMGHADRVNRQKQKRAEMFAARQQPQQNKTASRGYAVRGSSRGGGQYSRHASHPLLSQKKQFDGISQNVSPLVVNADGLENLDAQNTNPENRQKLEARPVPGLQNRQQLRYERKFNPRPSPFGSSS